MIYEIQGSVWEVLYVRRQSLDVISGTPILRLKEYPFIIPAVQLIVSRLERLQNNVGHTVPVFPPDTMFD